MRAIGITSTDMLLQQVGHLAIITWERLQREQEAPPLRKCADVSRLCPACSNIWRIAGPRRVSSVVDVERPTINSDKGSTRRRSRKRRPGNSRCAGERHARRLARSRHSSRWPTSRLPSRGDRRPKCRRPSRKPGLRYASRHPQGRTARCARDQSASCQTHPSAAALAECGGTSWHIGVPARRERHRLT